VFWVISVYFNIRNTLPKSGTFLLGHPVYVHLLVCYLNVTWTFEIVWVLVVGRRTAKQILVRMGEEMLSHKNAAQTLCACRMVISA